MADDWASDVKKYAPAADDNVIAAIVRYCGISLRTGDAAVISFNDPVETGRVRENFLRKKLALTDSDSELDEAIASIGQRMAGDATRNRVTVYYLLAAHFGKLGLFGAGNDTAAMVAPVIAPAAAPIAVMVTQNDDPRRVATATGWGDYLPLALLVLGGIGLLSYLSTPETASFAAPVVAVAAPAVPAVTTIPDGAGLVSSEIDGAPFVSVYFDTAKTDVAPEITGAAAGIKAYLDSHAGTGLAISGYNDLRGDAAMNAELSKNRAFAVRAALGRAGIPESAVDLVRPEATTDTSTTLTNARRVDIRVVTLTGAPMIVTKADAVAAPMGQ